MVDGKTTLVNDLHPQNAFSLIIVTPDGIDTSTNEEQ